MATRPRLQFAGATYHVTQHATGTDVLFRDEIDYRGCIHIVRKGVLHHDWVLHDYCLMPNHLHMLLTTREANIAAGMRYITAWYCRKFNVRHGRRGRLAAAPYYSGLIETDGHFLEVRRYLALNPVGAGLCEIPEGWRWSGFGGGGMLVPPPTARLRAFVADRRTRPVP